MVSVLRLMLALLLPLCLLASGCEGVFVGFVSNPVGKLSVSGTVSVVQLGLVKDVTGEQITITAVAFLNPRTAITISFCGDQSSSFLLNQFVHAEFSQSVLCAALAARSASLPE
jgi:hypothetical protein